MKKLAGRTAVIADRHPLWLEGMGRLLDGVGVDVVATTTSPEEMIELVRESGPDVLVLGLGAGPADAAMLEAVRELRRLVPETKVVILAPSPDSRAIKAAFSMGVSAYCMKSAEPDDLMAAIRQSFEQSIFLGSSRTVTPAADPVAYKRNGAGDAPDLTKREIEILRLVAEGYSNSQAAERLWVTEQTVKFHLSNVYKKLNVANRTEASRWAQVHGLLPAGVVAVPVE